MLFRLLLLNRVTISCDVLVEQLRIELVNGFVVSRENGLLIVIHGPSFYYFQIPRGLSVMACDGHRCAIFQKRACIKNKRRALLKYEAPAKPADPPQYLLAFKDHSIYTAVAYWVDGDTLHYFTTGNIHNQASISLLDRELTERLNRELGIDFKLPAAK